MKILTLVFILAIAASCTHKNSTSADSIKNNPSPSPSDGAKTPTLNASDSTFQLYRLKSEEPSNVVFSPLSLKLAFELLYPGSSGENTKLLESIFGLSAKTNLYRSETQSAPEVKIANGVWMKDPKLALPSFKEALKALGAEIGTMSVKTINDFVKSATQGKIEKLINSLDPSSALIAVNAIYFKGDWKFPFKKENTTPGHFQSSPYKTVVSEMMAQTARFQYTEDQISQWIDLPYQGESMVLTLILPKKRFELKEVHQKISAATFRATLSKMKEEKVRLILPKFKVAKKESMKELLTSAGYGRLFASEGWGKIAIRQLNLSDALQAVALQIDEKGTEAAAATAVMMTESSLSNPMNIGIKDFICDQPFIFILRNKKSGEIHFMGKLYEPDPIKN